MIFLFSSRRRHTRFDCDWSSDVCSSDLFVIPTDWTPGRELTAANNRSKKVSVVRTPSCKRSCRRDRKSTRLNSSHSQISYAVFCLKKKNTLRFYSAHIIFDCHVYRFELL